MKQPKLHFALKLAGLFPFHVKEGADRALFLEPSTKGRVYGGIVAVTTVTLLVVIRDDVLEILGEHTSPVLCIMDWIGMISVLFVGISSVTISAVKSSKHAKIANSMFSLVSRVIASVEANETRSEVKTEVLFIVIFCVWILVSLSKSALFILIKKNSGSAIYCIVYCFNKAIAVLLFYQFSWYTNTLKKAFITINELIKKMSTLMVDFPPNIEDKLWRYSSTSRNIAYSFVPSSAKVINLYLKKVRTLSEYHVASCDAATELNKFFSHIFLFITCYIFVRLVIYSTVTCVALLGASPDYNWTYPALFGIDACLYVAIMTLLVISCEGTCQQANRTAVYVHKLLNRTKDKEVKEELVLFSKQLLHRKLHFTACGFFTLDFTLLYSFVGAVTTYLVILVQFQFQFNAAREGHQQPSGSS